jgi:hypothetical protein
MPAIAKNAGGNGVLDATTDPFLIAIWWRDYPDANIGLALDAYRFALDVDPRHGGDDTLFALERQHGSLPHTLMSHTGGQPTGNHFFFTSTVPVQNKAHIGEGLDVQGPGSYVIVPPSIHPETGTPYIWDLVDGPDDIAPQPAPPWLEQLVSQASPSVSRVIIDHNGTIPSGDRNNQLAYRAIAMRRAGLSLDSIYAALAVENQQCTPPLDDAELRQIAYSKLSYMPDPRMGGVQPALPPSGTPGHQSLDLSPPSPAGTAWGTPFNFDAALPARDLLKLMRVPPRFLIDKLVPDGLVILAAPAKSYKSYFSLSLALATAGQGDWCDTFPVESTGNVVFFGLEAPPMQLRNRMHQLRPGYNPDASPYELTFFSGMQCLPTFKNGLQHALEQVIERYQPRLIVIDPLSYLYRLGRQDDLASATLDLLWPLAEMAAKAQVAIFAPEHMRKRSKEDVSVVDQLAGSHIKAAVVHGLLMVHREGDDIIIETTMRDAPAQELALTLTFDNQQHRVMWGYKGANATLGATRIDSMKTKALEELKTKRYPMKVMDLIATLGLPNTDHTKNNLRQILHTAEKHGDVAVSKRGEYYWIGQ